MHCERHEPCRQCWTAYLKPSLPLARGGHGYGQLFGHIAHAQTSDVQRQAATDHLDFVQPALEQEIRKQRL